MAFYLSAFNMAAQAAVTPVYQINEAPGTYLQTTLTHDIYRYSASAYLNDLVVVDKQGNKLPYRIAAPSMDITEKSTLTPVRFFPVEEGTSSEKLLALSNTVIRVDDLAITVHVGDNASNQVSDKKLPVDFYLVDISNIDSPVNKLLLDWQASETSQYLEVQLSGTNDLQHWQPLASHTLVQLQKEEQTLLRNSIPLDIAPKEYAYLRLKFLRGGDNLQLTQIRIESSEALANARVKDSWEVAGMLAADQNSALRAAAYSKPMPVAAWEFERNDGAPINNLGINLGASNYGDSIKVYSRRTNKQPWQLLHQGIWFNVQVGNDWQHSDAISIYASTDSYWRVELNELVRTTHNPVLVFERQPQVLQFIANNAAPFSIAIDSQAVGNNQHTSTQIFSQLITGKNVEWQTVSFIKLEPNPDSFSRQMTQVNWKTLLFWGFLLVAVGVLIVVAVRLFKQMQSAAIKHES
jgi:hypothetical protein